MYSGQFSGSYINSFLPDIPIYLLKGEVIYEFRTNENFPFRLTLEENDLLDWIPQSKLYLFHGIGDEQIPYENSVVAYDSFIENGANSELVSIELLNEGYGGHNEAAPYCLYGAFILSEQEKYYLLKGDLNLDNDLDLMDVMELKYLIKLNIELENLEKWYADINSDEFVNSFDLFEFIYKVLEN